MGDEVKISYKQIYETVLSNTDSLRKTGQCRPENHRFSGTHDSGFYEAMDRAYDNPKRYIPIMCEIIRNATLDGFATEHYFTELEQMVEMLDALEGRGVFSW